MNQWIRDRKRSLPPPHLDRNLSGALLETCNLTRQFGKFMAVDNLNIAVAPGEVFGLLGPNGAGKSTTIKMLTTLLPPSAGSATIAGFDVARQAAAVRRWIGYVPQALSADGTLTGYENLLIFAKLYDIPAKQRRQRIQDVLAFMGLQEAAHRTVRTYSGGMIRRLEIAQSILHRPKLLFLDEPTVGLDPLARSYVWALVKQLCADYGTTIVLTTHFLEEADNLCQRVAMMHHGKVIVTGTPTDLKASLNKENATLDDVFIHHTGDQLNVNGVGKSPGIRNSQPVSGGHYLYPVAAAGSEIKSASSCDRRGDSSCVTGSSLFLDLLPDHRLCSQVTGTV